MVAFLNGLFNFLSNVCKMNFSVVTVEVLTVLLLVLYSKYFSMISEFFIQKQELWFI